VRHLLEAVRLDHGELAAARAPLEHGEEYRRARRRVLSLAVAEQRNEVRWEPCKVHQEGVLAAEA